MASSRKSTWAKLGYRDLLVTSARRSLPTYFSHAIVAIQRICRTSLWVRRLDVRRRLGSSPILYSTHRSWLIAKGSGPRRGCSSFSLLCAAEQVPKSESFPEPRNTCVQRIQLTRREIYCDCARRGVKSRSVLIMSSRSWPRHEGLNMGGEAGLMKHMTSTFDLTSTLTSRSLHKAFARPYKVTFSFTQLAFQTTSIPLNLVNPPWHQTSTPSPPASASTIHNLAPRATTSIRTPPSMIPATANSGF